MTFNSVFLSIHFIYLRIDNIFENIKNKQITKKYFYRFIFYFTSLFEVFYGNILLLSAANLDNTSTQEVTPESPLRILI